VVQESNIGKNAADAMEEAIAWHTVCIISEDGKSIGTGSLIRWRGRKLILTARHVVQDSTNEGLRFHFRPEGTMKRAPLGEVHGHPELRYRQKVKIEIVARHAASSVDLAALELADVLPSRQPARFFDLDVDATAPGAGTVLAFRGYPSDMADEVHPGALASFAVMDWGQIERPHDLDRFDPAAEFLVKFSQAEGGIHARGFSGTGSWYHCHVSEIWHPNLRLAGVCTHYYAPSKLLNFLRVENVTAFLRGTFAE